MSLLKIDALNIAFQRYRGLLRVQQTPVVRDISLQIARGEVLAVIGASGAGKSLLAHAILGLLPPNATITGTIAFNGTALTAKTVASLRGRRIALLPQSIGSLDPLARTHRQLGWAARRAGMTPSHITPSVTSALTKFGLLDAARQFPRTLSGGMARRVLLAIATIGNADLIIADEPTNGLDPAHAQTVLHHLAVLAANGAAIMIITHDLCAALPFATNVLVLDNGRAIETAPATAFAGQGETLTTPYAHALWNALPQNGFAHA